MSLLDAFRNSPLYRTFDNNGNPVYTFVGSAEDKPADGVLIRPNEGGFDTEPNSETIPGLFHLKVMDEFITGIYTSLSVDEYGNFLPSSLEGGSYSTDGGGQFSSVNLDNEDFIWIIDNFETLSEKYSFKSDASSLSDAFQTWIDSRVWANNVGKDHISELETTPRLVQALKDWIYGSTDGVDNSLGKFSTFFGPIETEQKNNILKNLVLLEGTYADPSKIPGAQIFNLLNFKRTVSIYLSSIINPEMLVYSEGAESAESFVNGGYFEGNVGEFTEITDDNKVLLLSGAAIEDRVEDIPVDNDLIWFLDNRTIGYSANIELVAKAQFLSQAAAASNTLSGISREGIINDLSLIKNHWIRDTGAPVRLQGTLDNGSETDLYNLLTTGDPSQDFVFWDILREVSPSGTLINFTSLNIYLDLDDNGRPEKINLQDTLLDFYLGSVEEGAYTEYILSQDGATYGQFFRNEAYAAALYVLELIATDQANKYKAQLYADLWNSITGKEEAGEDFAQQAKDAQKQRAKANQPPPLVEEEEDELADVRKNAAAQCALLANIDKLAQKYIDLKEANSQQADHPLHGGGNFYKSRFYSISSNEPTKTLTKIQAGDYNSNIGAFLGATPADQAYLVPKIKLQKVIINQQGVIESIDIPFDTYTKKPMTGNTPIDYKTQFQTPNNVFKGGGSGIKSMSFEFDGETPATADKYVKADLKLFFQDFGSLFEDRLTVAHSSGGTNTTSFKYIDLLVNPIDGSNSSKKPDTEATEKMDFYDPSFYRIKVEIGWDMANNVPGQTQLKNSLDQVNKTFLLCALDHEINVNNDGTVELSISYRGYGDTLLKTSRFNALIPYREQAEVQALISTYNAELASGRCTINQRAEFQATIGALQKKIANQAASRVIGKMTRNRLIHRGQIPPAAAKEFEQNGAFTAIPDLSTTLDGTLPSQQTDQKDFSFFFLGDLLFTILDCQYFDDTGVPVVGAENLKIILTDMNIRQFLPSADNDNNTDTMLVPISSIPIAIEQYKNWFMNEILGTDRYNMPVMEFIQRFTNDVCGCFLSEICFTKEEDKSIFFRQGSIIANKSTNVSTIARSYTGGEINIDEQVNSRTFENDISESIDDDGVATTVVDSTSGILTDSGNALNVGPIKPFTLSSGLNGHEIMEYAVIYVDTPPKYISTGTGVSSDNLSNGILHLHIGADRGILKTAKWSKQNVQYLREARMFRSQGIGNYAQLATYYNVSLNMFGNFLLTPGMIFYLDPFGIGGSSFGRPNEPGKESGGSGDVNFSRLMGIGGYHLVTGVNVTITPQKFETTVEGRFVFSGDSEEAGGVSLSRDIIKQDDASIDTRTPEEQMADAESCRSVISVAQAVTVGGS